MTFTSRTKIAAALICLFVFGAFQNCSGPNAINGSPAAGTRANSVGNGGTTTDNPMVAQMSLMFVNSKSAVPDGLQINLCIMGAVFSTSNGIETTNGSGTGGIFNNGIPELSPQMSNPLSITDALSLNGPFGQELVSYGTYSTVIFLLNAMCPSGSSIQVTNSNGTFSTSDPVTLSFYGSVTVSSSSSGLKLNLGSLGTALSQVTSDQQLVLAVGNNSGTITP